MKFMPFFLLEVPALERFAEPEGYETAAVAARAVACFAQLRVAEARPHPSELGE